VPEAPDPLGKRALFWAPAERHDVGPRRPEKRVPPGRHALFSASAVTATGVPKRNGRARPQMRTTAAPARRSSGSPSTSRRSGVAGPQKTRAASSVRQATGPRRPATPRKRVASRPVVADKGGGPITLTCSRCAVDSDVDVVRFVMLHLPMWFWRPGRGYTSLMRCPACGKRTWLSTTWRPKKS
jgi:hypothetical protein